MSLSSETTDLIAVFEANIATFFLTIGRANGSQEYEDAHIHWILGDAPKSTHNVVVRSNIPSELVDEHIREVIGVSQHYRRSCLWKITPSTQPENLAEWLLEHDFVNIANPVGMIKDLSDLPAIRLVETVTVEQVRTEGQLDDWLDVMRLGFGFTQEMLAWQRAVLMKIGLHPDGMMRHYIAYWQGRPAGISTLFVDGEVAGIYYVATAPEVRNKGIGTAVTLAALQDGRDAGCRVAVLEASEMGYPVYARMGFREICKVGRYQWNNDV